MPRIQLLDPATINQIAAGEVVERPASVVKELVENAIDAGATAITVEIKDGGTSLIRITDNGCGIEADDVPAAFLRHSTSKIRDALDLLTVTSLGFRGEALSSIAAVSRVELITKPAQALTGIRYRIEGGEELLMEEVGCPNGTTILVRNLFYNTPARRKFLKTDQTEAGYISDLLSRMALSHPEVSLTWISNGQNRIHTAGNMKLSDIIYSVYGRDITANLLEINQRAGDLLLTGWIGKPLISRGNRNYENYFINGRYIRSGIISRAIEDAYKNFVMVHKYPFTALHLTIDAALIDVNVHPSKMEIRFKDAEAVYQLFYHSIREALSSETLMVDVSLETDREAAARRKEERDQILSAPVPEPFETARKQTLAQTFDPDPVHLPDSVPVQVAETPAPYHTETSAPYHIESPAPYHTPEPEQLSLFERTGDQQKTPPEFRLAGQVFGTYWIVECGKKMYIIDQHAAHEKVLYEKLMKHYLSKTPDSQILDPPLILTLNAMEALALTEHLPEMEAFGFEIEAFGGNDYCIRAVPTDLYGYTERDLFIDFLDQMVRNAEHGLSAPIISERIASMACKAAIKGNTAISAAEASALIRELLEADDPYNCPHGRPTIVAMTQYELDKKFRRIQQ